MRKRILAYIAYGIAAIIVQKFLSDYASVDDVVPQLIVLFVVYVSLREGQLFGMGAGFLMGLVDDIFATHFIGYTSFIGVVAGFVAGFFFKESDVELSARTFSFAYISAITVAVTQLAALPIIASGELNYLYVFLKFTVGTTIYTSAVAMIIVFVNGRKSRYV